MRTAHSNHLLKLLVLLGTSHLAGCAGHNAADNASYPGAPPARTLTLRELDIAESAMAALQARLELAECNLANAETPAYKARRAALGELPAEELRGGRAGVRLTGTRLDMTQGRAVTTSRDLDVYIDGPGFLRVTLEDRTGRSGLAYTRLGALGVNAEGELVPATIPGARVEPPISVPDDAVSIAIDQWGDVRVLRSGMTEPEMIGTLELACFRNPEGLLQLGEGLFAETSASGTPRVGRPSEGLAGVLRARALESSNVDPVHEKIEIARVSRLIALWDEAIGLHRANPALNASVDRAGR